MRRKLSHKRKLNKLEEREFLQQLVKTLRDSSDDKALQLLGLIRSQAPPAEFKLYIENDMAGRDRKQNPVWADMYSRTRSSSDTIDFHKPFPHCPLTTKRLPSPPVYHIPAELRTSVTKYDDCVASGLALVYADPAFLQLGRS
ncbi:hypothetical protein CBS147353_11255 [Aspergillus niger]|nr:hypothetical protein CBS147353_11255 [Aspergillus niger]